ncbi:hypothetical protein BCR37DRAFT_380800 [Protomyces lactucae-debilis]|uniref:Uncharacterized protein n=1 Tax=Protomyces lactucae-debilis TaxID=2754530 RepID=A0A1Y2FC73_PROLT|nr:uncharacterized protein BCR37DRAFT_380800 [Protomyces lactucae-debilis]ORY80926.1 hypothetical protein BCR37DRAFT_380800 [Protomyces lactucae-debilis]
MSTDEAYSSFLDKANSVPEAPPKKKPSNDAQVLADQYLSSESDEPWRAFTSNKTDELEDAAAFAKLVEQSGDASFAEIEAYEDHKQVIRYVRERISGAEHGKAEVHVLEITDGTRIYVYMVAYNKKHRCYEGAQSLKIES